VIGELAPFLELMRNLGSPIRPDTTESLRVKPAMFGKLFGSEIGWTFVPENRITADVDPCSGPGFCQIKGSLLVSETVPGVSTPEPESHPVIARGRALRDLVSAVDHLTTGKAHELEMTFTAFVTFHGPHRCIRSFESLFARSGRRSKHVLVVVFS